jgi:hypothetical protein
LEVAGILYLRTLLSSLTPDHSQKVFEAFEITFDDANIGASSAQSAEIAAELLISSGRYRQTIP